MKPKKQLTESIRYFPEVTEEVPAPCFLVSYRCEGAKYFFSMGFPVDTGITGEDVTLCRQQAIVAFSRFDPSSDFEILEHARQ